MPIYDAQSLKQVVGDNPETIKELQQTYLRISAEQMQTLETLWQTDQADQRVMLLHKLKSSSRSTGALYLGQRFEYFEQLSRKSTEPLAAEEWQMLVADYDAASNLIRKELES